MGQNANETVGISKKTITIIGIILILIITSSIIIYNVLKPKESKDKYNLEEQLSQGYKLNYYNVKEDISNFDDEWRKEDSDNDGINNEDEYTKYNTNPYLSDTDNDGLSDYEEIFTYKSLPLKYSSANDGVSDYIKVNNNVDVYSTFNEDEIYNIDDIVLNDQITIKPKNINYKYDYKYDVFTGNAFNKYTKMIQPFYLYSFKGSVSINLKEQISKYNTSDFTVIYWDYSESKVKKIESKIENDNITFDLDLDMYNPITVILTSEYEKNITESKEYNSRYVSPNNTCNGIQYDNFYKTTYDNSIDTFSFDNFVPTNDEGTPISTGMCFGMAYTQMLRYNYKNNNRELNYDNVLGIPSRLDNSRSYDYSNIKNKLSNIFNEPGNFTFDTNLNRSNNGTIVNGYNNTNTNVLFSVLTSFQINQESLYKERMVSDLDSVMDDLSCSLNDNQISNINYCYNFDGTSESCHSVNAIGLEKSSIDNSYRIYISDTNLTTLTKNLSVEQMPYILLTPYMDGKYIATVQANKIQNNAEVQGLYNAMNITRINVNLPYIENEKLTYYSNSYNLNNVVNNTNKDNIKIIDIDEDIVDNSKFNESGRPYERVRFTGYWYENFRTTTSPDFGGNMSCSSCDSRGFWADENGWYRLRWWSPNGYWVDSIVIAAANSQWPDSPKRDGRSAGGTWSYRDYITYRDDWEKFEVILNNTIYNAINLDLCGACSCSKEERGDETNNRLDIYLSDSSMVYTIPEYGYAN